MTTPKKYRCSVDGELFDTQEQLEQHDREVHHREHRYRCNDCDMNFESQDHLDTHNKNIHKMPEVGSTQVSQPGR